MQNFNPEILKWYNSDHDQARLKRMIKKDGYYINCRHFVKPQDGGKPACKYHNSTITSCYGCTRCPNCDGVRAFYDQQSSTGMGKTYVTRADTCVQCGAYLTAENIIIHAEKRHKQAGDKCQVEGCCHTAYEKHTHTDINDHGVQTTWTVCESHFRRVKTWRYNPEKGLNEKPLIVREGKLYDNPDYRKQHKRKARQK